MRARPYGPVALSSRFRPGAELRTYAVIREEKPYLSNDKEGDGREKTGIHRVGCNRSSHGQDAGDR